MSVILIGMPGCGKSTTGVVLAKSLGMDFVDTDILIQQREKLRLQQIIDRDGIDSFLDAEERAICGFAREGCVIATGGSAVLREKAMLHLKSLGPVVYLELGLPELVLRLGDISSRGIALSPGRTIADLFVERIPLYVRWADVTVDCSGLPFERVVDRIVDAVPGFHKG